MIFETVSNITNKEEFLEKILIYIRLVEVLAEREEICISPISVPHPSRRRTAEQGQYPLR